jgi:hypothetical protein
MKYKKMKNKGIILGIITSAIFFSCGTKESGPWDNFKPLSEIDKHIAGYYDASLGQAANPKSGNPAVYVDFSDGIKQAFNEPVNINLITKLSSKLNGLNVDWFGLGKKKYNGIGPLTYKGNELPAKVKDPLSYVDIYSPIEDAIKKIVSSKNDAILITDFELIEEFSDGKQNEITQQYAADEFISWLKNGNSISFFYHSYSEKVSGKNSSTPIIKNLYFTVFTFGKTNENSIVIKVNEAFKGEDFKNFELNNTPYSVANNYGGKDNTGIVNKDFAKWATYNLNASADSNLPYEVIGINKPWSEEKLEKYVQKIITKEDGLFLNKLTMNAEDQKCFKLNKVAVKVYDVSADYEKYAQCNEVINHMPVLTKNEKKEDVWDEKTSKDAIAKLCYNSNSTVLKPEWTYSPKDLKDLDEVFDLNKSIFEGHLKNEPAKIELQTVFHANYNLKKIIEAKAENALLRVDYVIEDATFNDANTQLNDFQWMSSTMPGKPNSSLSESIRNTLQETAVNPKGKIIYTYYIKFGYTTKSEK